MVSLPETTMIDDDLRMESTDRDLPGTPGLSGRFRVLPLPSRREREVAMLSLRMALRCGWHRQIAKRACDEDLLEPMGLVHAGGPKSSARELQDTLQRRLRALDGAEWPPRDSLQRDLSRLGKVLRLGRIDLAIVRVAYLCSRVKSLDYLLTTLEPGRQEFIAAMSGAIGERRDLVQRALSERGALRRGGLVELDFSGGRRCVELGVALMDALLSSPLDTTKLLRSLIRPAPKATLALADFDHIPGLDLLRRHLAATATTRRAGVNVLLYGEPGTGKTELVRTLAAATGMSLHEVPNEDGDGDAISGMERFKALLLCQRLMDRTSRQLLLFDEVEDVFGRGGGGWALFARSRDESPRKGWINELLETNPVPTVWVCNAIGSIDPAYLRRFDLVLECRAPGPAGRERIIAGQFRAGEISPACARRLAAIEDLAPSHIARAARVVRGLKCRSVDARDREAMRIVEGTLRAMGKAAALRAPSVPEHYDLAFLNTDGDLAALTEGLRHVGAARVCLYGPPGTGKTAFAHHLGRALDRPVLVMRGSDLLGQYVGETEKRLASAFARASDERAILVIDEADSFLRDRTGATRSWEVTQVNELLTQMEAFDGLFIASTNLIETLDAAALRRFDFKLKFDYLRAEQRCALLRAVAEDAAHGADAEAAWAAVAQMSTLTPGDMANVLRQCALTGQSRDIVTLARLLLAEQALKPGAQRRGIGFTA